MKGIGMKLLYSYILRGYVKKIKVLKSPRYLKVLRL